MNENDRVRILKRILSNSDRRGRLIIKLLAEAPPSISTTTDSARAEVSSLRLIHEEEDLLLAGHPGKSCDDAHPGEDHDAYVQRMKDEEGKEEHHTVAPRFTVRRSRDTNEAILRENTRLQQGWTIEKLRRLRETTR